MISCYRICEILGSQAGTQLDLVSGCVRDPYAEDAYVSFGKGGFRYYDFSKNVTHSFGIFTAANVSTSKLDKNASSGKDLSPVEVRIPVTQFKFLQTRPDQEMSNIHSPRSIHWFYKGFRVLNLDYSVSSKDKKKEKQFCGAIECLACSSDGSIISWGTGNGCLFLYSIISPNTLHSLAEFDGRMLFCEAKAHGRGNTALSELESLEEKSPVSVVEVVNCERKGGNNVYTLVTAGSDAKIKVWKVTPSNESSLFSLIGIMHTDSSTVTSLSHLVFSNTNQTLLISGNSEGCITVWNLDTNHILHASQSKCLAILDHSTSPIYCLATIPHLEFSYTTEKEYLPSFALLSNSENFSSPFSISPVLIAGDDEGNILIFAANIMQGNGKYNERLTRQPWVLLKKICVGSPVVSIEVSGTFQNMSLFVATCENGIRRYTHNDLFTIEKEDECEQNKKSEAFETEIDQHEFATQGEDGFDPPHFVDAELDSEEFELPIPRPSLDNDIEDTNPPVPRTRPYDNLHYFEDANSKLTHIVEDDSVPPPPPNNEQESSVNVEEDTQPPPPPPFPPGNAPSNHLNLNPDVDCDDYSADKTHVETTSPKSRLSEHETSTEQTRFSTDNDNIRDDDEDNDINLETNVCYDGWLDCDIPPLPLSKHHEPSLNSTNKIKLALETARLELKACKLKTEAIKAPLDQAQQYQRFAQANVNEDENTKPMYNNLISVQKVPSVQKRRKVPRQISSNFERKTISQRIREDQLKQSLKDKLKNEGIEDDSDTSSEDSDSSCDREPATGKQRGSKSKSKQSARPKPWFEKQKYPWAKEDFYLTSLDDGKVGFKHFHSLE